VEQIDPISITEIRCRYCQQIIGANDSFCGQCGKLVQIVEEVAVDNVFSFISPTIVFYFITLILLSVYKMTDAFPDGVEGILTVSIIDVIIVIAFAGFLFKDLRPLLSLQRISLLRLMMVIVAAIAGGFGVHSFASLLDIALHDDVYYSPYLFQDTAQPLVWAVIMTCVQPAIFEEIAFRGFMFSNLQPMTTATGTIYITAFLFGVMHLSFVSLIWLVPLGLAFAWLRVKYNTLWYGIAGHFVYNFTITLIEFYWK
jgi:uncharacterized protein